MLDPIAHAVVFVLVIIGTAIDYITIKLYIHEFVSSAIGATFGAPTMAIGAIPLTIVLWPEFLRVALADHILFALAIPSCLVFTGGCLGWLLGIMVGGVLGMVVRSLREVRRRARLDVAPYEDLFREPQFAAARQNHVIEEIDQYPWDDLWPTWSRR